MVVAQRSLRGRRKADLRSAGPSPHVAQSRRASSVRCGDLPRCAIETGDAFLFKPGEAHQITNDGSADLVLYVVADNPIGESNYFPDSDKWAVRSPERRLIRSEPLDYFDGEE